MKYYSLSKSDPTQIVIYAVLYPLGSDRRSHHERTLPDLLAAIEDMTSAVDLARVGFISSFLIWNSFGFSECRVVDGSPRVTYGHTYYLDDPKGLAEYLKVIGYVEREGE